MNAVTIELSSQLYATLESLAEEEQIALVEMLRRWAELTRQRRRWLQNWVKTDPGQDARCYFDQVIRFRLSGVLPASEQPSEQSLPQIC